MFESSTMTETEVLLAGRGDREAFARLVAATRSLVASIALVELRDVEAARDVSQEVYLQVWDDLHQLRNPASFLPFLRQVTRLRARRVAERRAREVRGAAAEEVLAGVVDPALDPRSRRRSSGRRSTPCPRRLGRPSRSTTSRATRPLRWRACSG